MPKSPRNKLAPCSRVQPIPARVSRDDSPRKSLRKDRSGELQWKESLDLLDRYHKWEADVKAQGLKPSVRQFEKLFSTRNRVSRLLNRESKLRDLAATMPHEATSARHRIAERPLLPVEYLLYEWLQYFRDRHIPINQKTVCLLAKDVYRVWIMNGGPLCDARGKEPTWSRNWAEGFIRSWSLKYYKMSGEASSVDLDAIKDEVESIKAKLDTYDLEDIYNCDETGMYTKWMTNWTLDVIKRSGVKPQKGDRVSVLFCTNATGTDKRKPLILSMHMPNNLSPHTKAQLELQPDNEERVGYMRRPTFMGWLQRFQADIFRRNPQRRVLLLMDNAPGHLVMSEPGFMAKIPNVEIVTLPKNSTSITQPLDAGMIAVFKNYYQDFLALSTMVHLERRNKTNGSKKTTSYIPNNIAWKHIVQAWNLVTPETVRHCFRHVPIFNEHQKAALSSTPEGDRIVELAHKKFRLSISQVDEGPRPNLEMVLDGDVELVEDETPIVLCEDSFQYWSAHVDEEDRQSLAPSVMQGATIIPSNNTSQEIDPSVAGVSTSDLGHIEPSAPLPLHSPRASGNFSSEDQIELLSHRDTPEMHFNRLHSELGASAFVAARVDAMRNNPAFARFFTQKPVKPGHSDDDQDDGSGSDGDDADDLDYHYPQPRDIPTISYIKKIGRGNKTRRVEFGVDQVPESGSSGSSGSPGTPGSTAESRNDLNTASEEVLESTKAAQTVAELEESGEVLRMASQVLLENRGLLPGSILSSTIEGLELAYDSTMSAGRLYHRQYLRKRLAERRAIAQEIEMLDDVVNNPFL